MAINAIASSSTSASVHLTGSRTQHLRTLLSNAGYTKQLNSEDVRDAAALLVSELGFKPMLAEMRNSPFESEIFGGGRTEAIFGEQLDERLADTVAQATGGGIADRIANLLRTSVNQGESDEQPAADEATANEGLEVIA
ncbi:MAG: rod-binding protein [Phycisphaerae bacterium]|nr:rod-binding protein [Phycisphaerae bacterium]